MKARSLLIILGLAVLTLVLLALLLVSVFRLRHRSQPLVYGVSFSKDYSAKLGLDWEANYRAVFEELGIKKVRLMSYWNNHEAQPGGYDFSDLDKQFEIANQNRAKVSLSLGLRQPRWPECHQPDWAKQLDRAQWRSALNNYLQTVVERYRNNPALESWQLENEYFNKDFGANCPDFSRGRLQDEFNLVKHLDQNHPVMMNQSNQVGLPLGAPHPDLYGFSVYKRVYEAKFLKSYITHPIPAWFHSVRAQLVEMIWRKPVVIHELQAEPWTARELMQTSGQEQGQTMSTQQLRRNLNFAKTTGIKEQYLWGAEYWYWRKTMFKDPSYWQVIQSAVQSTLQ